MKVIIFTLFYLVSASALAQENCEPLAVKAARLISIDVNQDSRPYETIKTLSNSEKEQVVTVYFDTKDGGAHVGYTVTVERNASPIQANQTCQRVTKVELTSEE